MRKVCTRCGQMKEIEEFYKHKSSKSGFHGYCKKCMNKTTIEWNRNNKERKSELNRKNYKENRLNRISANTQNIMKKYNSDTAFRYKCTMGSIIRNAYKAANIRKSGKVVELIGITGKQYAEYLESLFVDGMTHENHGTKWHIDHVIPLASFDLNDPEQAKKAFHYSNTRPYPKKANLRKGDSLDSEHIKEHIAVQTQHFLG